MTNKTLMIKIREEYPPYLQVILHRCASHQDSPLAGEGGKEVRGLDTRVFEAMSFITHKQIKAKLLDHLGATNKHLIRYDHHWRVLL